MNELGIAVIWSAIRVTIIGLVALALYGFAVRRGPRAGGSLIVLCLASILMLTPLAFCPLPDSSIWLSLDKEETTSKPDIAVNSPNESSGESDETPAAGGGLAGAKRQAGEGPFVSLELLNQLGKRWGRLTETSEGRTWGWPGLVALIFMACGTGCLLRLLFGIWAIHDCRRRSRPINDPAIDRLMITLSKEMGCRRKVDVRESADLAGPATIGWLHPVILLPEDWRTWSPLQCQAVLAHELSHVVRCDYLAWFLGRITLAVHFYHPLIWWLTNRLQLQQELAADAQGARLAGGQTSYLVALSQMALRQEGRLLYGSARSFLSTRGTLMRRIHMLRGNEITPDRPLSRLGRVVTMGVLLILTVTVAALRGPVQSAAGEASVETTTKKAESNSESPLDYSYVLPMEKPPKLLIRDITSARRGSPDPAAPPTEGLPAREGAGSGDPRPALHNEGNATNAPEPAEKEQTLTSMAGVYAARPSAFFGQPGMKKHADKLDTGFHEFFRDFNEKPDSIDLPVQAIEQVAGRVVVSTTIPPKGKTLEHPNVLMFSLCMIRTLKPFDWKKHLLKFAPKTEQVQWEGKSYYKLDPQKIPTFLGSDPYSYFYVPDERTIVFDAEECLKRLIRGERAGKASYSWTAQWTTISTSVAAVAVESKDRKLVNRMAKKKDPAEVREIMENLDAFVMNVDIAKGFHLAVRLRSSSDEGAKSIVKSIQGLLKIGLAEWDGRAPADGSNQILAVFTKKMLEEAKVDCKGREAIFQMGTDVPMAKLISSMMDANDWE
jgi:beta-lactamase regulating signal transducer with metallopeptidase domain